MALSCFPSDKICCLVCLGFYKKNTIDWGAYEQPMVISYSFVGWEVPRSWCPHTQCLVSTHFLDGYFFTVTSCVGRSEGSFWGLFYKGTNTTQVGYVLMT